MSTYIFMEGLLRETGTFELFRAFETKEALSNSSHFAGKEGFVFLLFDGKGDTLYSENLPVVFNHGCNVGTKVTSSASIRAAIPLFAGASKLVAHYQGQEVFSSPIAGSGPKLSGLKVSLKGHEAILKFSTNSQPADVRVFARLSDKRLVKPNASYHKKEIAVDLNSLSGQGEVNLVVEATKMLRTSRVESDPIETPPASATGLIIEPADKSRWSYKKRGSLIASVFDENGRQLNWDQSRLFWKVNGKALKDNRQMTAWSPEHPGNFQIQLVKKSQQGQEDILSESNVEVLPPTEAQKEYEALIKTMMLV